MYSQNKPFFTLTKSSVYLIGLLSLGLSANSQASTYQQAPLDQGNAIFANTSSGAIIADNFSFASTVNLYSLSWWGSYDTSDSDAFIIDIYADAGGSPGTLIQDYSGISATKHSTTLTDISSAPVFRYDYTLPSALTVNAGHYYLNISNETTVSGWYWLTSNQGDTQQWALSVDNSWLVSANDLAFNLNYSDASSAVPEPSLFSLMVLGLAGITARARFSRA